MRFFLKYAVMFYFIFLPVACNSDAIDNGNNVILLMLDGVRWQEVFNGTDPQLDSGASEQVIFKYLHQELSKSGFMIGDRTQDSEMTVSNPTSISLPAYQSIMAGYTQDCLSNNCSKISVETVQERIKRELHLDKYQVATIASWSSMALAVEHIDGSTFVNTGKTILDDGSEDPELARMNQDQLRDPKSWPDARLDKHTISQSIYYLKKHRPRFLFISLNDSDEWAHSNNYTEYIKSLHQYDEFIKLIHDTLDQMGSYGKSTTLIVTTDHGRGNGVQWKDHGWSISESKYTWLYAKTPTQKQLSTSKSKYNHLDIRPTIEAIMNLTPLQCDKCGKVISELLP